MRIDILTLFPEMLAPALDHSIIGRARKKGLLQVCCHQLRDFAQDRGGRVDDTVFGGGKGMLLAAEPLARGIDAVAEHLGFLPHILYMSPRCPRCSSPATMAISPNGGGKNPSPSQKRTVPTSTPAGKMGKEGPPAYKTRRGRLCCRQGQNHRIWRFSFCSSNK